MDYGDGRREASEVYEANLSDLVPPPLAALSSPSSSVYGGTSRPFTTTYDYNDHTRAHRVPPSTASYRTAPETQSPSRRASFATDYLSVHRPRPSLPSLAHHDQYETSPPPARFSYSNVESSYRSSGGLPSMTEWDPAWQSGGYTASGSNSHEGRGFTHHPPPLSTYAPARVLGRQYVDPYPIDNNVGFRPMPDRAGPEEEREDEDQGYGWMPETPFESEFKGLGGEYKHGVGFPSPGSLATKDSRKVAERLRKLEREFGAQQFEEKEKVLSMKEQFERAKAERKREKRELIERSGVDSKGRLVVMGSKKRATSRWLQGLGAFGVALGSIGAALFTKPIGTPPPKEHYPIWLLYCLPFVSLGITIYFFLFRPYCSRNRRQISPHSPHHHQVVLPLLGPTLPDTGGCCCFGGRQKASKNAQQQQGGATVNLLLDPALLAQLTQTGSNNSNLISSHEKEREKRRKRRKRRHRRRKNEKDVEAALSSLPSTSSSSSASDSASDESDAWSINDSPSGHQRKGILSGTALEGRWKDARKALRKIAVVDALCALAWGATASWAAGWGGPCTPGGFEGYCNFYNSALACSAFVAAAFLVSFVFDCLDLRRTRAPPRLRQQRLR